jgi:hypothetical protein
MLYCKELQKDDVYYDSLGHHLGFVKEMDDENLVLSFYFTGLDSGGQDHSVLLSLFKYMTYIYLMKWPKKYTGKWYLVMNILENNHLIESGVSIRVPWLTPKGHQAMLDMKEVLNA